MHYEYRCPNGHLSEMFFKTIGEGAGMNNINCHQCNSLAEKIFSIPLGFAFYGSPEGYSNPSATKRDSYKTISRKTGNA